MKSHFTSFLLLPFAALAADTNPLPPLAPAYPEMSPTFWEQQGAAILVGGFILLALAAFILWQLLTPRPQPIPPPETIAREALAKLQRQPEDGKMLSAVSQILRRFFGTVFGFPGGEMTTAEFCAAIAGNEKIGAELAQTISNFLRECDERKFSAAKPAEPLNAVARALALVVLVEKRRTGKMPVPLKNERRI